MPFAGRGRAELPTGRARYACGPPLGLDTGSAGVPPASHRRCERTANAVAPAYVHALPGRSRSFRCYPARLFTRQVGRLRSNLLAGVVVAVEERRGEPLPNKKARPHVAWQAASPPSPPTAIP